MRTLVLLLTLLFCSAASYASNGDSSIIVSVDAVDAESASDIEQQVNYKFPFAANATVYLSCFQYRKKDSICLYNLAFNNVNFQQGFHSLDLNLRKADTNFFLNNSFFKLLAQFKKMPPGFYKTYITINCKDSSRIIEKDLLTKVDSVLAIKTRLRSRINKALAKTDPSKLGSVISGSRRTQSSAVTEAQADVANVKIDRSLRKMHGITTRPEMKNGKAYIAVYYEDWFLGKYEVMAAGALNQKIAAEYNTVKNNASSLVDNQLEGFTSISSQVKDLYTNKEDKNLTGNIDLTSVFATGQEQGSQQDNNYVEVRANAATEVFEIPINVEGYYTTQDNHRQAKASYFRVHYDAQTAKSKLSKIISGFKGKYNEAVSQQTSLQSIYGNYLGTLNGEKAKLTSEITHYGIDLSKPGSLGGNSDQLLSAFSKNIDTSAIMGKDSSLSVAEGRYQRLQQKKDSIAGVLKMKYEELQETEQKIEKYTKLLDQYKEKLTLDSGLVYSKVQELSKKKDVSYKEMAKAAAGLLPEGKARNFVTGLTHFDLGIINEYQSDYTMSGQTLKGGSLGYDFGFVNAGLSAGKTEYISRDGNVDQYSSWLLRLDFKPVLKQKLGLIYYTYSPGKKVLEDNNFIKSDITAPSIVQPVHIFSLTHEGDVDKNISLKNEAAVSYKQTASAKAINGDNIAVKTTAEYRLPKLNATLQGEYEHVGKDFENSSLPYIKAAIERYTLATEADLFRSFLTVGVQYNFLKQEAFAATGYSTKWGFDIKTNSRRYPNVSLSYKPYTTFRTYDDTFNIQQRPLSGEVWTARGSYQIRRHLTSHRFVFIFNQNSTNTIDTQSYSSKMWQLGYIYVSKANVISINTGLLQLPQTAGGGYNSTNSYFINAAVNKRLSERVSLMLGQDAATCHYGLQRLATTIGTAYSIDKIPITLRLQVRYSNVKSAEDELRRNLWAGQIGANWQFKTKLFSKNDAQ